MLGLTDETQIRIPWAVYLFARDGIEYYYGSMRKGTSLQRDCKLTFPLRNTFRGLLLVGAKGSIRGSQIWEMLRVKQGIARER